MQFQNQFLCKEMDFGIALVVLYVCPMYMCETIEVLKIYLICFIHLQMWHHFES